MKSFHACVLLGSVILGAPAFSEKTELVDVVVEKTNQNKDQTFIPYANMELRHYTNTYYDTDDYLLKQEPSAHIIAQLGLSLYQGYADIYATFGAVKLAQTQQVLQRRPQIELDIYPIYNENYSLTQYTIVEMPFAESGYDPENVETSRHGSIISLGLAQVLKYDMESSFAAWKFKLGADIWTELYSRKQPRQMDPGEIEQFSLARAGNITDEESEATSFNGEVMVGLDIDPNFVPPLAIGISVHYKSNQDPTYYYNEGKDELFYSYKKEETSHYRFRTSYKLSERMSFINDLYHFHDGFFQGRIEGAENRRLRNVARIQVKL